MVLGKLPVLIWMIEGHEPTALAVGAGVFFLPFFFLFLSPSLYKTAQYRLKYCLKRLINWNNQPTNSG